MVRIDHMRSTPQCGDSFDKKNMIRIVLFLNVYFAY
jgi:hypothetical protein